MPLIWFILILGIAGGFMLTGCDNNYQPKCTTNCVAGGGDDSFGAGAQPLKGQ